MQPAITSCNEDLYFFAHFKPLLNYQSRFGDLAAILTAITGHQVSQNIPRLKDPVRLIIARTATISLLLFLQCSISPLLTSCGQI